MKKALLSISIFLSGITSFCTTWIITNTVTFAFSPATITITLGDSVNFQLAAIHNVVEVSLATWNVNGITPLPGFSTPFGGGLVLPAQLTVGTHYYVCQNHVALEGMKGTIIVQNPTGITDNSVLENIRIYPNPSNGILKLEYNGTQFDKDCGLEIYNVKGEKIYQSVALNPISEIDLSYQSRGIYFVKIHKGQAVLTRKILLEY